MSDKKQLKILVVDDDDAIRLALVSMIQIEGFTLVEANNGISALEIFEREKPDIVLLDTVMPEMNGYEVCKAIRKEFPDIYAMPVLMITMMDDPDSIQRAQDAGASDYLIKPIQWPLLMYRLHVLFRQKQLLDERKKIEEKLRQTHRLNAISQLTGGFAHDFNNILASQLGYTELALNYCDDLNEEKLKIYLGEVQKASLRAKILIEQLMAFAMDGVDMTEVSEVAHVFSDSVKALLSKIPQRITFDAVNDVKDEWVGLDFLQFHQILMNLLENSVDAMDGQGSITVKLEKRCVEKQVCTSCLSEITGQYLVLSVTDTGSGIDQKILQAIFEPFYTTKPVGKGTGHGMSVVHGIAHASGGHIHIDSTPGKGSTIEIYLLPVTAEKKMAM